MSRIEKKEKKRKASESLCLSFSFSFYFFSRRICGIHMIAIIIHRFLLPHPPSTFSRIVAMKTSLPALAKKYIYFC